MQNVVNHDFVGLYLNRPLTLNFKNTLTDAASQCTTSSRGYADFEGLGI